MIHFSKYQRILWISWISSSMTDSDFCTYHLVVWSNFDLLYDSKWIIIFCLIFLLWLTISSLSPHNPHLLFCWVISIFVFIYSFRYHFVLQLKEIHFLSRGFSSITMFLLSCVKSHQFLVWNIYTVVFLFFFFLSFSFLVFFFLIVTVPPYVDIIVSDGCI